MPAATGWLSGVRASPRVGRISPRGALRTLCTALLLLLLGACSSTTFVYNRLDVIIPWYLDDYVELNAAQEKLLDDELLPPFLYWHRMQELPQYIAFLSAVEAALDEPVELNFIQSQYLAAEAAVERLEAEMVAWMLVLGDELSDEQMAELVAHLYEQQQEYEEEFLGRNEKKYRAEAYDNFADSLTDFLGRLDKAQRQRLRDAVAQMERADAVWLSERARWLQQLEQIFQRPAGWQQLLLDAMAARDQAVSADYQRIYEHNLRVSQEAITDVLNSRTERQDKRLRRRLADLKSDFSELIAQGEASGPPSVQE